MIRNYMEELVDYWLGRILTENEQQYEDFCRCPFCMAQVKVEALNQLKPFYVVGQSGTVFAEYKQKEVQYKMDLMVAITQAIENVSRTSHKERGGAR